MILKAAAATQTHLEIALAVEPTRCKIALVEGSQKQGSTPPRAPCVGAHLEMYVTEEMMENPRFTRAWKPQSLKTGARNPMSAALFGENGRFAVAWRPILQAAFCKSAFHALKLPAW